SIPDPQVERILLDALNDDELFWSACVGLTSMKSQRAGPPLHQRLATLAGRRKALAIKALGRMRYEPARGDLIALLDNIINNYGAGDAEDEWELTEALGSIGGKDAYDKLAERYAQTASAQILCVLLDSHDDDAFELIHQLIKG